MTPADAAQSPLACAAGPVTGDEIPVIDPAAYQRPAYERPAFKRPEFKPQTAVPNKAPSP